MLLTQEVWDCTWSGVMLAAFVPQYPDSRYCAEMKIRIAEAHKSFLCRISYFEYRRPKKRDGVVAIITQHILPSVRQIYDANSRELDDGSFSKPDIKSSFIISMRMLFIAKALQAALVAFGIYLLLLVE
ncbi:hypothetical protein KIN20_024823 [Parelaphostrongylus tenuis]|uniref:Uncharacterized protein n=1 Tax=Parelaphostrongylus tenuis TaxID=148309 RepID=A0AAD5N805_PARTN|nr:hypothetical protein KIN20_024814 [Parelaphostrongylus tenuis]KAJ1364686.1 hypothetical protein KIN20_024823 [Parelaphostrongylus tenuis]